MTFHRLIFVSAVSNEFHHGAVEQWRDFQSYRDVLKHAFHNLDPTYKVLTQEDLVQGVSGLLQTLEREIAHSLFMVHLVGDLAGEIPQLHERRVLVQCGQFAKHLSLGLDGHKPVNRGRALAAAGRVTLDGSFCQDGI